jgi:hypothetical protein
MSTVPAMDNHASNDTTPRRDAATLAAHRRRWRETEKARQRYEAALITRNAAIQEAMDNGWTSNELGEAVGVRGITIRKMISRRRK